MRGGIRVKNLIVVIAACLLLLTACGTDVGALLPTGGTQPSIESKVDYAQKETDASEESVDGEILLYPITYQVDLSRDEVPEVLTVSEQQSGETVVTEVVLAQDGVTLWSEDLELDNGLTKKAYFLVTIEEEEFLALYRAYLADGSYRYTLEVFDLEGGAVRHVDNRTIRFQINDTEGDQIDSVSIGKFAKWINWYLDRGILLCSNDNGVHTYSTQENQRRYEETFADAFVPAEDYSGCTTVEEKAERYNALHDQREGDDTLVLTKPEGFDDIAAEMMAENKHYLQLGVELAEDRDFWYQEYNEWAIQVIRDDPAYSTPIMTTDTVYYFVRDDKTVDEVAVLMLEVLIAEAKVSSKERDYVVTDFRIPPQRLIDAEEAWEDCLKDWNEAEANVKSNVRAFVRDWLLYHSEDAGFLPIGEEMWYFVPEGWFSYTGKCDGLTLEEAREAAPDTVVGDKVPLISEDCEEPVVLVLMKQGNVYRLQSVKGMQETYEKLQNAEETTAAEIEEE